MLEKAEEVAAPPAPSRGESVGSRGESVGSEPMWARVGAWSGIVFMLLGLGATFLYTQPPRIDSRPATMLQWAHTHRAGIDAGMILAVFGSAVIIPFVVALRRRMTATGNDFLGSVTYGVGLGYALMVGLGALPLATLIFMDGQPGGITDGDIVRFLVDSYQIIYAPATIMVGAMLLAVGSAALRTTVFATWVGWVAIVIGVICAVETVPIMINSSFHPGPWAVVGWIDAVGSLLVILALCIEILRRPDPAS
jgi:hypothetical protein